MHFLQLKNYIIIYVLPDDEIVGTTGKSEEFGEKTFEGGYKCKIFLLKSNFRVFFTIENFRILFSDNADNK